MLSEGLPLLQLATSLRFQGALAVVANWTGYEAAMAVSLNRWQAYWKR